MMGLREFARAMGVRISSVEEAIASGRLTSAVVSIDENGRKSIVDLELARAEWEAHTLVRASSGPAAKPSALEDATLRERLARARSIELETEKRAGRVISTEEVERILTTLVVQAKTALLGLPTRARQRLPHLTAADTAELDRLVREVLTELADGAERGSVE